MDEQAFFGALDIGGSNLRANIVDLDGKVLHTERQSIKGVEGRYVPAAAVGLLEKAMRELGVPKLHRAAASMAGLCDYRYGVLVHSPNILEGHDIPMREIGTHFDIPFDLYNDGNAAAMGVLRLDPQVQGMKDILYLIMGTGIGAGIVADGMLFTGANGYAGEFGHMAVMPRTEAQRAGYDHCGCKLYGCWESFSSGAAIERAGVTFRKHSEYLRNLPTAVQTKDVFDGYRAGCEVCMDIIGTAQERNLQAVATLVQIFDPEAIVLGEALMANDAEIRGHLIEHLPSNLMAGLPVPKLYKTELSLPGIEGAAFATIDAYKRAA